MAQPTWNKTLKEVLQQNTVMKTRKSAKGTEYDVEVVPHLEVVSTGSMEEHQGEYRYSIVDTVHQLEYMIKAPNKVDVAFGTELVFDEVSGGTTQNGRGWYKAEAVALAK